MALSRKTRKILWIIAAVAVAAPIVIVLVVLLKLDAIVRMGVERGGSSVLGVQTRLKGASVSILRQKVSLTGLDVANPPGFQNATFVKADLVSVRAQVSGLMKKEVHLYEVVLEAPEFSYEAPSLRGKTNVDVLMENMKSGGQAPTPANEPQSEPVKLKIDLMRVTNAKVHVVLAGKPFTINLAEIEIKNLDDGHGNAIPPDKVLARLLLSITSSVVDQLVNVSKTTAESLTKNLKEAGTHSGEIGKGLQTEGEKAAKGIKGLFGK